MNKKIVIVLLILFVFSLNVNALSYVESSYTEYSVTDVNQSLYDRGFEDGSWVVDTGSDTSPYCSGEWCAAFDSNADYIWKSTSSPQTGSKKMYVECAIGDVCEVDIYANNEIVSDANVSFWALGSSVFKAGYIDDSNVFHHIDGVINHGFGFNELFSPTWVQFSYIIPSGNNKIAFRINNSGSGGAFTSIDNIVVTGGVDVNSSSWTQYTTGLTDDYYREDLTQSSYNRDFEQTINYNIIENNSEVYFPLGWKVIMNTDGYANSSLYTISDFNKGDQSIYANYYHVTGDGASDFAQGKILLINNEPASNSLVTFSSKDTSINSTFCSNLFYRCQYHYGYVDDSDLFSPIGAFPLTSTWTDINYFIPGRGDYRAAFQIGGRTPYGISTKIDNVRITKNNTGTFYKGLNPPTCSSLLECSNIFLHFPQNIWWVVDYDSGQTCEWFIDGNSQGNMTDNGSNIFYGRVNETITGAYNDTNLSANCTGGTSNKSFYVSPIMYLYDNIDNGNFETSTVSILDTTTSKSTRTTCDTDFCAKYTIATDNAWYGAAYKVKSVSNHYQDGLNALDVINHGSGYQSAYRDGVASDILVYSRNYDSNSNISFFYSYAYENHITGTSMLIDKTPTGEIAYGYVDDSEVFTRVGNFTTSPNTFDTDPTTNYNGYIYGNPLIDYGWNNVSYQIPDGNYRFAVHSSGSCSDTMGCRYNANFSIDNIMSDYEDPSATVTVNVYETGESVDLNLVSVDCNGTALDLSNQTSPIDLTAATDSNSTCTFSKNGLSPVIQDINFDEDKPITIYLTDGVGPVTSYNQSNGSISPTWNDGNISFTLSCSDGWSDCNSTEYKIGAGSFTPYVSEVTISTEGDTNISYRSTDSLSNVETTNIQSIKIDLTSPSISSDNTGDWYLTSTLIDLNCVDDLSDGNIYYKLDNDASVDFNWGEYALYTSDINMSLDLGLLNGIFGLQYYCTDGAGNISSTESEVVYLEEGLPPTPTVLTPETGSFTNQINISCDAPDWYRDYNYSIDFNTGVLDWNNVYEGANPNYLLDVTGIVDDTSMTFRCKIMDEDKNSLYLTNTTSVTVNPSSSSFDSITSPTPSVPTTIYSASAPFSVDVNDSDGIKSCEFKIYKNSINVVDGNGIPPSTDGNIGVWSYTYTDIVNGDILFAYITCDDNLDNSSTTVSTSVYTTSITAPGDGGTGGGGGGAAPVDNTTFEVLNFSDIIKVFFGTNQIVSVTIPIKNSTNKAIEIIPVVTGEAGKYYIANPDEDYTVNSNETKEFILSFLVDINATMIPGEITFESGSVSSVYTLQLIYDSPRDFFSMLRNFFDFGIDLGIFVINLWIIALGALALMFVFIKNRPIRNIIFLIGVIILFLVFSVELLGLLGVSL